MSWEIILTPNLCFCPFPRAGRRRRGCGSRGAARGPRGCSPATRRARPKGRSSSSSWRTTYRTSCKWGTGPVGCRVVFSVSESEKFPSDPSIIMTFRPWNSSEIPGPKCFRGSDKPLENSLFLKAVLLKLSFRAGPSCFISRKWQFLSRSKRDDNKILSILRVFSKTL